MVHDRHRPAKPVRQTIHESHSPALDAPKRVHQNDPSAQRQGRHYRCGNTISTCTPLSVRAPARTPCPRDTSPPHWTTSQPYGSENTKTRIRTGDHVSHKVGFGIQTCSPPLNLRKLNIPIRHPLAMTRGPPPTIQGVWGIRGRLLHLLVRAAARIFEVMVRAAART